MMDNLRGFEPYGSDYQADVPGYAVFDDEDAAIEAPPVVSTDERRMQVRAYNFWTAQLNDKNYPSIEELDPAAVEDFRDYSVLLDFTSGIENPSIEYLGEKLRSECGLSDDVTYLDQVPSRSLLSRITDHYLQIIANRAPIGFEAEFINDRGVNIMYRGILLPYSSDDDTIDFIYGVINWKEAVAIEIAAPLQLEVEQALAAAPPRQEHVPVWADGPTAGHLDDVPEDEQFADELELDEAYALAEPQPDENSSLADWLDAARQSADSARDADMRTREALYQAIGRAHDFALVAAKYPADYAELLSHAGLVAQERAKFTPIVKLVFGVGYDKTRLTEFATALQFADRNAVPMGGLAEILSKHEGGLKGIIAAERRAKKVAAGQHVAQAAVDPRSRLRTARARDLSEFAGSGEEFVLLVARRDADGNVAIVGAVDADAALTEKALRKTAV
ncbi:hypothetical protein [Sphingorhabdus contaminans]|uniref:hypothetical protein n=1 Tax=Sphingorhabdus contaminans TaxID=1343899 RepID=UPI003D2AE2AF